MRLARTFKFIDFYEKNNYSLNISFFVNIVNMTYKISEILEQGRLATSMIETVRDTTFSPISEKKSPVFNLNHLLKIVDIDRYEFTKRSAKGDLPLGLKINPSKTEFTLSEIRAWAQAYGRSRPLGENEEAVTICVANSKGGVGKTTTSMCLGQALALKGYRVLVIDLDPQGSLSSLCGLLPDTQVDESETVLPLCAGKYNFSEDAEADPLPVLNLDYAVKKTYWDGLDVIPSAPVAFAAEFFIPARQLKREQGFRFWEILKQGIENLKHNYEIVIIDCAPTMSYLTLAALWASDGLIMPMPPKGMDYASSAQFWMLFTNLIHEISKEVGTDEEGNLIAQKEWEFINVLLSMVDVSDPNTLKVQSLINATYAGMVLPVEIPKTSVTSGSALDFSTVYDITKYAGSLKTYERARVAYDRVVDLIEQQVKKVWEDRANRK